MTRVPVIIPTLCRYEHFKRCVESLQRNKLADETELFIGLDYPAKESHVEGYKKIKEYIDNGISGFLKVNVIRYEQNVGSSKNSLLLREAVYERFDRYIYSEDDNEFAPSFLEYMNYYMTKYEADEEIVAVTGYSYPFDKNGMDGDIYMLNTYFAAFGYGIWKRKQDKMLEQISLENLERSLADSSLMANLRKASFNQFGNFVKGMVGYTNDVVIDGKARCCDLTRGLQMFFEDKKMIFPKVSLVRNWGYDGSGVNCDKMEVKENQRIHYRNFDFTTQELDERKEWGTNPKLTGMKQQEINRRLQDYFYIPKKEKIRTMAAYCAVRVLGRKKVSEIIKGK